MKIVLLEDVKGVGRKMDVKEVKDGYGRNYLLPKKLAVLATPGNLKFKEQLAKREEESVRKLTELAKKLENISLEFRVKTGFKGEIFGSIKADDVKKSLREQGLGGAEPVLEKPLKTLGEHAVPIDFGRGVKGKVKIRIAAEPGSRNSTI